MSVLKRIALIAALCVIFRGFVALGADAALDSLIQGAIGNEELVQSTVLSQSPLLQATAEGGEEAEPIQVSGTVEEADEGEPETAEDEAHLPVYVADEPDTGQVVGQAESVTDTGTEGNEDAAGIALKNSTDYEVDVEALLSEPLTLDPGTGGPQVLIIHTHGTESYTPDENDWYDNTDNYRSVDESLNVIRVGDEIAAVFEEQGISVIHDRQLYDYPSYVGSYPRSLEAVESYLAQYPDIQIVIDVHRDAILDDNGSYMKTVAELEGVDSSQVMLVVGTDASGLEHPLWRENMKFALRLQAEMNSLYPSLARPINVSEHRYNQHAAPYALILEVGTNGNTLQEAVTAGRLFAECAANVINGA